MREPFFGPEAWTPLARALRDYQAGDAGAAVVVHSDVADPDPMPVSTFFRGREGLRPPDRLALELARGRVLDGGAGVGSLALLLQESGVEVTALDVIPEAVEIMKARGVRDARLGRLETLEGKDRFDTILLLMNGTALAGTLAGMPGLLRTLDRLLAPGGQVLVDSTDLSEGENREAGEDDYPGEVHYQLEYLGVRGVPFPQLFLDPESFRSVAEGEGWKTDVVWTDDEGGYLARLTRPVPGPS